MRTFGARAAVVSLVIIAALPCRSQDVFDLLLKGGHVIDPKNKRNERLDIAIAGGRVRKVAAGIPAAHARRVVDVSNYYVTPGLIDLHMHLDAENSPLGVNADHNALRYGVTTAVDAGSAGPKNFAQFKKRVIDRSTTRVLAFLDVMGSDAGPEAVAEVARKYPETIVGIKTQVEGWDRAIKAAGLSKTIIMVSAHSKPQSSPESLLKQMRPGDIYTPLYGVKVQDSVAAARKKGVVFDVGHGSGNFWFRIAVPAIQQGVLPDTISTGLERDSIMLPRATMSNVMSKFLAMGLTVEQVIERTTVNPSRVLRRPDLGSIEEGGIADIAVLELRKGQFAFLDSGHAKLTADKDLRCVLTVRNGRVVWDVDGLSLTDWRDAGPYSNFK